MDLPTSAHFIYIPGVLILGLVTGFIWGARLTREQVALEARSAAERAERKARRAAEKASEAHIAAQSPPPASSSGATAGQSNAPDKKS